ncbi:hypothetical protein KI387_039801 [Taxus chinensis]|uniref:Uncharacterized protein n=1 Tax=Taxus chinensis TaxID=29808 RepID=A0AA38FB59_TAXCH|nr:hypothetical protein KI387_039801 [Taxus chinensis]
MGMTVLRAPHQPVASLTTVDMEATPYQAMAGVWGEETVTLISCQTTSQLIDRVGKLEIHPFDRVPQQFGLPYSGMLPLVMPVYRSIREAWGGPRGQGWTIVMPGTPIVARRVVRARGRAGAPQAPLLWIAVGPTHSSDEPINVDFESEEFTRGETEEEIEDMEISEMGGGGDDSDPEWHDTQEILQAERVERSTERVTLVSEELLSRDPGGDGESVAGHHISPDVGEGHQSVVALVAGVDPRDPSWRPGDPSELSLFS